jgi:NADH-quinone oxidoreductase subunit H
MKAETLVFELLIPVAKIAAVILYPMIMVIVMIWLERRVVAWIQGRVGPNRVGFQGILQPTADALKLFFKEDIIQKDADTFLFNISPPLVMFSSILAFCFVPLGESFRIGGYASAVVRGQSRRTPLVLGCLRSGSSASSSAAGPRTPSTP